MKKRVAAAIIIVIAAVLCIGIGVSADKVIYPCAKAKAVEYLCDKYDAEKSEFKLVDHRNAGAYWDASKDEFFQHLAWKDFAFEFEYNGKNFYVNRCNGKFFDDYQLNDIELWCTEWLQSNVDKSIIGVQLSDEELLNYMNNCGKDYDYTVSKNDINDFLNNYSHSAKSNYILSVYYYDETVDSLNPSVDEKAMTQKLKSRLNLDDRVTATFLQSSVDKKEYKSKCSMWFFEIA